MSIDFVERKYDDFYEVLKYEFNRIKENLCEKLDYEIEGIPIENPTTDAIYYALCPLVDVMHDWWVYYHIPSNLVASEQTALKKFRKMLKAVVEPMILELDKTCKFKVKKYFKKVIALIESL